MGHQTTLTDFLGSLPAPIDCHGAISDTVLAKQMRDELALAVTAGVFPAGTRFSVRKWHHASFYVEIVEWVGAVFTPHYTEWRMDREADPSAKNRHGYITEQYKAPDQAENSSLVWRDGGWLSRYDVRCTDALNDAVKTADVITDRHNYDNSDSQTDHFDYGYSLSVGARMVIDASEQGIAMEADPAMAEIARRAAVAAKALGPACTKALLGRRGLVGAHSSSLEHLIKLADKANGRPVMYDKRRRSWIVDKSVYPADGGSCVACGREACGSPEQTGHNCGRTDRVNGGDITERVAESEWQTSQLRLRQAVPVVPTRYFRCWSRDGKPLGDTPFGVNEAGNLVVMPKPGLVRNDTAVEIDARIMTAINAGKRGGTVYGVNWTVV